ncbi:hypothetical protein TNCV_5037381 [Trichonephila clavipes]|nr:hypothetical protein TNCV_5037381 [Trichonephila clavipes]
MLPVLGKKAVLEWCMKEGLIGTSNVCPKCGKTARGFLATYLAVLNHGQLTRTTPELATHSPNFHTTPKSGLLSLDIFNLHQPSLHGEASVVLAARRLHESNLLESSKNAFKVAGSIAFHHLPCYLTTLDLNILSNLNIPFIFLELIRNKREFIFPKKTSKKISGNVPYRFVTSPPKRKRDLFEGHKRPENKLRNQFLDMIYSPDDFNIYIYQSDILQLLLP